jgi:hypothetical protein
LAFVGGATRVFDQGVHIVGVQNAELGGHADGFCALSQQPHPQGMEGANANGPSGFTHQLASALAHFGGGLVGEGDGCDAFWGSASVNELGDFVGDDPRFARTCTGEHQAGAMQVMHRLKLGKIKASRHKKTSRGVRHQ